MTHKCKSLAAFLLLLSVAQPTFAAEQPSPLDNTATWYKRPLLSQLFDEPEKLAGKTEQQEAASTTTASQPSVDVQTQPVTPTEKLDQPTAPSTISSNVDSKPTNAKISSAKSGLDDLPDLTASTPKVTKAKTLPSAPTQPRSSIDKAAEPTAKPWYRKFYVRADYGINPGKKCMVYVGQTVLINELKKNTVFNVGIGHHLSEVIKIDLNFQRRNMKSSNGELKVGHRVLMLNTYLNLINEGLVIPYVTAGVGWGKSSVRNSTFTLPVKADIKGYSRTKGVWNIGAGVTLQVSPDVNLDLTYRYLDLGKFKFSYERNINQKVTSGGELRMQEFTGGLIINF